MASNTDVEHASLRAEILESGKHIISVANIVVTLAGAAILAAFQFRNPYVALLPLFPLYYGHLVAFSTSQTIARTSVYLRFVQKERYEDLLHSLRLKTDSDEHAMRLKIALPSRWITPHTVVWEQWISPILQVLFIILGYVCLIFFGLVSWLIDTIPNTTPNATPDLVLPLTYNIAILIVISIIWIWITLQSKRGTNAIYGEQSMIKQFEDAWNDVVRMEVGKTVKPTDSGEERMLGTDQPKV
jgi:hypothetical protein